MHDIVHYVHALLATCVNPRDFHGVNVVKLLKKSMGRRQTRGLFVSPLAHLALCNAGDAADPHLRRLKNMAYRRNDEPRWLGEFSSFQAIHASSDCSTPFGALQFSARPCKWIIHANHTTGDFNPLRLPFPPLSGESFTAPPQYPR
ncbi:hypothetical protein AVEN_164807-1 [Araneus ventricosus]|uniref:Uncharacterized protein n=1 Tax=Araneus ventricosus TaxID=182803 RepID=A0A4Y2W0M3_ARAVE|nr:hypothetical protein AVEN_164807-1 [Araneus ventricosus]